MHPLFSDYTLTSEILFKLLGFLVFCILVQKGQSTCNTGWHEFDNEKCYKVLEDIVTEENAATICNEIGDSSVKLLEIYSESEQQFLTDLIFNQLQIFDSVWLGAQRFNASSFKWSDGSNIGYSNWENGIPSNNSNNNCSQLYSGVSKSTRLEAGHWTDVPCSKRNLVVCQSVSILNLKELQTLLFDLRKEVFKQTEQIYKHEEELLEANTEILKLQKDSTSLNSAVAVLKQQVVPIGFIYTEYPSKQSPKIIWPNLVWKDVTSEYAGKFFRALGGDSAGFGTTQEEGAPRLTSVQFSWDQQPVVYNVTLPVGAVSGWLDNGRFEAGQSYRGVLRFATSGDKVRPINYAVRMWERTG